MHRILFSALIPLLGILTGATAFAGDPAASLDPASAEALLKTQSLLTTPEQRDKAVRQSPDAQLVDSQVHALGGSSANVDDIYGLASDVFDDLVKQTGGDPEKMQALLKQARDDPKGFAERMSDRNQRRLREISGRISGAPTTAPSPRN